MAIQRTKKAIGKGISLTVLTDPKFKTNSFYVHFILPLTAESAADNAAAAFILEDSCRAYPTLTALSVRLSELYGANLHTDISRLAGGQVITVCANCIADKYALGGEQLSRELLDLLFGCIFEPVTENGAFPVKTFALKKQELIDDIDAEINEKRSYALKMASRTTYANEPESIAVKGEREDAENISSASVYAAYEKMFRTARIEIFFSGSELPQECEQLITERFSQIERSEDIFCPKFTPSPVKSEPKYITERMDVTQSKMVMSFKFGEKKYSRAVCNVFNGILGSTPFSMLFKNVREKMSLCYYCSSSISTEKHVLTVDSGVEQKNITAAREEIIRQLGLVADGSFTDEHLEQTKLLLTSALKSVGDTPRAVEHWYFGYCLDSEEDTHTPEQYIDSINAVSREDVIAIAKDMFLDTVYVLTGKEEQ